MDEGEGEGQIAYCMKELKIDPLLQFGKVALKPRVLVLINIQSLDLHFFGLTVIFSLLKVSICATSPPNKR